jgi:alpha-galactosidase/6-phospho-beta-glucosidase family protein
VIELNLENERNRQKIQELVSSVNSSSPSRADLEMEKFYKGEIEKLNRIVQDKNSEIQRFELDRASVPRNDSKVFELEKQRIIQQYEFELSNRNREIEKGRENLSEYEKRIIGALQEIDRLNALLKRTPT